MDMFNLDLESGVGPSYGQTLWEKTLASLNQHVCAAARKA